MTDSPPTPKGRRTRDRILEAARIVFEREGLHAARIADIAEEAGLSPSAFYRYFSSKAEVLEAVAVSSFDAVFEAVGAQGDLERSLAPAERFRLANRRYLAAYCDNALGIRLLEQHVATNPLFKEHRRGINQRFIPRLAAVLGRMMEAGEIDDRYDATSLADALSAMVDRSAYINFVLRGHRVVPQGLAETIDILWENVLGIAPPEGAPSAQIVAAPYPWMYVEEEVRDAPSARGMNTQELLMRAATEVFAQRGFLGSRMTDIASAADVAHGTVYNYFDSRFDAFTSVATTVCDRLLDELAAGSGRAGRGAETDLVAQVEAENRITAEFYRANAAFIGVFEEFATVDLRCAAVRLMLRDRFVRRAALSLERFQRAGLADRRLDPWMTADVLVAMLERMLLNWFVVDDPHDVAASLKQMSQLWVRSTGIRTDENRAVDIRITN